MCIRDSKCTLQTDTEVITYIADYLLRRQGLTLEELASVIASPFWSTIERMKTSADPETRAKAERLTYFRTVFSSLCLLYTSIRLDRAFPPSVPHAVPPYWY